MAEQSSNTVRFLLGDEERQIADLPPTTTILNYLRKHERLTGTKEGCAEGDCGACTVVLTEPDGEGGVRSWPVNSCIQFVPMLHGRQLLTVEHLKGANGALHPVQQALVDHHASQCGFCTPGFVMQIFAAWKTGAVPEQSSLNDWLAGNLCRCTGYGPILAATEDVLANGDGTADGRAAGDAGLTDRLVALGEGASLAVEHGDQRWFAPRSVEELAEIYAAHPGAVLVGGATDVGLWVTKAHRTLNTLIDVTRIPALQQIEDTSDRLDIGAAVPLTEAHSALGNIHGDIDSMLRRFASTQIRSSGTVGGNIANGSPIGDLPPVLIALGAELTLQKSSDRRMIPLEDFFIAYGKQDRAPGEFVAAISVPKLEPGIKFSCHKISKRFDQDISAVLAAFHVKTDGERVTGARLAFGGMAATPKRAAAAEKALINGGWTEAGIRAATAALADDFTPLTDMRASADYRLKAAQNLLRRFWLEQADNPPQRISTYAVEKANG